MKTTMKISLISGLLASGIALANPASDTSAESAAPAPDKPHACHHGKHGKHHSHHGHDGHHGHHRHGGGFFMQRMADKLELTPEQRTSVKAVVEKSKPQMAEFREKMRANRKALRELARDGKADDAKVAALAQEKGTLVADMTIERTRMRSDIRAILTDTQRDKLKQMREQHRKEHHDKQQKT